MADSSGKERDAFVIQESQYRPLGASGIRVSPLGTGTNRWWQGKNDEAVFQAFHSLMDAGVNFFDTAEVYSFGKSERLLGACLQRDSRPVVVATKFAPYPTRLFRRSVHERSRCQFEPPGQADNRSVLRPFPLCPHLSIETLMDLMAQAVAAGKVRAVGVSNFNAKQMRRAATRLALTASLWPRTKSGTTCCIASQNGTACWMPAGNSTSPWWPIAHSREDGSRLTLFWERRLAHPPRTGGKGKPTSREQVIQETLQTIARQRGKS